MWCMFFFFFSSRRRHTRSLRDWSSDVCSSDLRLPVAASSDAIIASIGTGTGLHADFGSGLWEGAPIGIPVTVVGRHQAKSRVSFQYADESDRGPYPIPRNVKIEGGRSSTGDRHAIVVDRDACRLYELYAL